ncbi:MAG: tRNA (N6-threonylcarbamoyladenosine(37)-N6)-methyltransferase TrmO [Clostridia bacterium]|nr:tRNA (N6-threonylcarbamoyladenosine(37)-N6)-methyltransferase TrmO [Clostridia bacterium]
MTIEPIAVLRGDFKTKFGVPRQSGLAPALTAKVVFAPEYRDPNALRGLEGFSHLWLIWGFSENPRPEKWSPTVRPPRLGGNERLGVFATRSPNRPNPIGLSCVKLLKIEETATEGTVLVVGGADLVDGTPIYDVKPYVPYADRVEDATGGFTDDRAFDRLTVRIPVDLENRLPAALRDPLCEALALDPRPSYQDDPERVYGLRFGDYDVKFTVSGDVLTVTDVTK